LKIELDILYLKGKEIDEKPYLSMHLHI